MATPRLQRIHLSAGRSAGRLTPRVGATSLTPPVPTPAGRGSRVDVAQSWDALRDITWTLYRASPLHRFSDESLDVHVANLRVFLTRELSTSSTQPDIETCTMRELVLDTEGRATALHFSFSYRADGSQARASRTVLQGAFVTTGAADALHASRGEGDFKAYPLLLMRGPTATIVRMIRWLEQRFDCRVSPLSVTPAELVLLADQWSKRGILDPTGRPMELQYAAPEAVAEHLRKLVIAVDADSVQRLARTLPAGAGGEGLLRAIEDQFSARFKLQLGAFRLIRIGTQIAVVAAEGKAKFYASGDDAATLEIIERLVDVAAP